MARQTKQAKEAAAPFTTSTGFTIREVEVTPDIARQWLSPKTAAPNRSLAEGTVSAYSYSLQEGRWPLFSVMFDRKGKMRDGQHHLEAIVRTGINARMLVFENCPEAQLRFVDMGRARSTADAIRIATGDPHTATKVAMARVAVTMGAQTDNRVTRDLIETYLKDLGKEHVAAICELRVRLSAPWIFALVYARPLDPILIDEVFARITKDDVAFEGDHGPARTTTLRALLRLRTRSKITSLRLAHIVLRGLQALHEGEALAHLTEDSSGLAWANGKRTERGLPTVAEMLPATYPKPKSHARTRGMVERATTHRSRSVRSKTRPPMAA